MSSEPFEKTLAIVVYGPYNGTFVNELLRLQKAWYYNITVVAITSDTVPFIGSTNDPLEIEPIDLRRVKGKFDTVIVAPSLSDFLPPLGALLIQRTGSRILVKFSLLPRYKKMYQNHVVLGF